MDGSVGILNVGAGDTKIVFDPKNPADMIRAARIVKDMIRRGYALLVAVKQSDGSEKYQRAYDFDESKFEYVIADLDPEAAQERTDEENVEAPAPPDESTAATRPRGKRGPKPKLKNVHATKTRVVAVARSAGG